MITREQAAEYVRLIEASHGPRDRRLDDARTIVALYDEVERQRQRADGVLESASAMEHYAIAGSETLANDHLLTEAMAERDAARLEIRRLRAAEAPVTDDAAFGRTGWHFSIGRQCWVHRSGATVPRGPACATLDAMRAAVPGSV